VIARLTLLGPAGALLAAGLLGGSSLVPPIAVRAASTSARRTAPARGQFSIVFNDILAGAADLQAFGAADLALAPPGWPVTGSRTRAADRRQPRALVLDSRA